MTTWGGKLEGINEEQLLQQLRMETDGKAVKRLTSALLYRQGKLPAEIENCSDFPNKRCTIGLALSPRSIYSSH
ncbi:hypothetical protein SAMN04488556_0619 [Halostagnicola kamekurae]|uniref:Uncharacterized protein n=1 Tax=Halostagnicola kamekurae TaxID=619731 RepID=A0A1I6PKP1_9EURY|nr:hypothetical protein SAMN04488556_0619 [Halostagnicola kamekurae]